MFQVASNEFKIEMTRNSMDCFYQFVKKDSFLYIVFNVAIKT
jgi:hypothetical protein